MDITDGLRVTRRNWDLPSAKFKNVGFRCVKKKNNISEKHFFVCRYFAKKVFLP
jgi:hypothetical protein